MHTKDSSCCGPYSTPKSASVRLEGEGVTEMLLRCSTDQDGPVPLSHAIASHFV